MIENIIAGGIYKCESSYDEEARFIVTGIGLSHVLFADFPLIKFNGTYLEYFLSLREFKQKFKYDGETK